MPGLNINQVYTLNPITVNAATDLMYFGQSPYMPGNDAAMLYSNFALQFATAAQGMKNVNQTTASATLSPNTRYATNDGSNLVTYTIPAGAAIGDTYIIIGGSSGGWKIGQPASVQCHIGSNATTAGTGGSIASSNQYDACMLTCVATNTFTVYGIQGNLTIV